MGGTYTSSENLVVISAGSWLRGADVIISGPLRHGFAKSAAATGARETMRAKRKLSRGGRGSDGSFNRLNISVDYYFVKP